MTSMARYLNLLALAEEEKGKSAIRLHIGSPSSGIPNLGKERLALAMEEDVLGYT